MRLDRMTQRQAIIHGVVIAPAILLNCEETARDQLGDDPLYSPFGDADDLGDVTHPGIRGPRDVDQHMGVVGQEGPGDGCGCGWECGWVGWGG